ncbi:hypothetical protein GCM10011412_29520 [Maribacter cobaltidurans]|nr:hypothetical protein GCM10011412_29520 [Maribacter cobaltidurans]
MAKPGKGDSKPILWRSDDDLWRGKSYFGIINFRKRRMWPIGTKFRFFTLKKLDDDEREQKEKEKEREKKTAKQYR